MKTQKTKETAETVESNGGNGSKKGRSDPFETGSQANAVLKLIWKTGLISRAEIARRLSLSRSTVTEILKDLLHTKFVREVGLGRSQGGRRPVMISFEYEARCILGVDIGATHVAVTLTDLRGRPLVLKQASHPVRNDPEGTRALAITLCEACLEEWGKPRRLLCIGVAVPSPVDPRNPEWLSEVVIPAWKGRHELQKLHEHFGVPVYIDNDANLGALAEQRWGAGRDIDDLIYIKMAYGIGAGYIIEGDIYRGARGLAGEIGHLPIDTHGAKCVCGMRGCLVNFLGAVPMLNRARQVLVQHPESKLDQDTLTIEVLEHAALDNDPVALQIVSEMAEYLALALATWFNLMNPSMVILGGTFTGLEELFIGQLREKVKHYTLVNSAATAQIVSSKLGFQAVTIGAATLALEAAFADPKYLRRGIPPGVL